MTIAAGLLCRQGVLLGADTEETAWASKSHGLKIHPVEVHGGKIIFAYAGNVRAAHSAVLKCARELNLKRHRTDVLTTVEAILDREYRRNVLSHPDAATNPDLHYSFLLAIWDEKTTKLYVTDRTAIDEVSDYECIGIGGHLGRHLIGGHVSVGRSYHEVLPLAVYAFALIKDLVKDCGGMSIFHLLGHDGTLATVTSIHPGPAVQVEHYAKSYDFLTRRLLMHLADPLAEPDQFEANLTQVFNEDVRKLFEEMWADRQAREKELASRNPRLKPNQVRQLNYRLSMGLPPNPQP